MNIEKILKIFLKKSVLKSLIHQQENVFAGNLKTKSINLYDDVLTKYLNTNEVAEFKKRQIGIDISKEKPANVEKYLSQSFDYIITLCDNAKETYPVFAGKITRRINIGFDDHANAVGL